MITDELAWRVRLRGLQLDPNGDYENPRVAEIAKRQYEIMNELEFLDRSLEISASVNSLNPKKE